MHQILLINPNTSATTTRMMVNSASQAATETARIIGSTASRGVPMITRESELIASAPEVVRMIDERPPGTQGIIISAFGDPGLARARARTDVPVVGICEASILEASEGGRRFGIATVTPDLAVAINEIGRAHV